MPIKRVLCVLVVLVGTLGGEAAPRSKPGSNSIWPGGKTVIPWLEVNVPRKPLAEWDHRPRPKAGVAGFRPRGTVLDYCIDGPWRGSDVSFGEYGLQVMEPGRLSARQIEAARMAIQRHCKRAGKLWIRVFPDRPVTAKP